MPEHAPIAEDGCSPPKRMRERFLRIGTQENFKTTRGSQGSYPFFGCLSQISAVGGLEGGGERRGGGGSSGILQPRGPALDEVLDPILSRFAPKIRFRPPHIAESKILTL